MTQHWLISTPSNSHCQVLQGATCGPPPYGRPDGDAPPRPHTGRWGVQKCVCEAPPLRSPVPLPPAADHGEGEEAEEEG